MAKAKGERLNGLGIVIIILVIQYLCQEWILSRGMSQRIGREAMTILTPKMKNLRKKIR